MVTLNLINQYFKPQKIILEKQNKDYDGALFESNNITYRSRLAKKTAKKTGYFVVFWEKDQNDKNKAYSLKEAPDFTLVWIIDQDQVGLFKFPKEVLLEKNILHNEKQPGKMGIRVYPTWCKELNDSAKKTQCWQTPFFEVLNS